MMITHNTNINDSTQYVVHSTDHDKDKKCNFYTKMIQYSTIYTEITIIIIGKIGNLVLSLQLPCSCLKRQSHRIKKFT